MPACQHCQTPFEVSGSVSFRAACAKCFRDLHSCVNCEFHSPNHKWECRESIDERVADKEKANFCGAYAPRSSGGEPAGAPSKDALLSAAEALFGKKT